MQLFKQCNSYNEQNNLTITTNPLCTNLRLHLHRSRNFPTGEVYDVNLIGFVGVRYRTPLDPRMLQFKKVTYCYFVQIKSQLFHPVVLSC